MSRYDKYEPFGGGFRAPLAVAIAAADGWRAYGVGLDVNGRVVLGAGTSGVCGLLIAHGAKNIGDIVDVMTDGEVMEFTITVGTAAVAGTKYTAATATGLITSAAPGAGQITMGVTQTLDRLIVRVGRN